MYLRRFLPLSEGVARPRSGWASTLQARPHPSPLPQAWGRGEGRGPALGDWSAALRGRLTAGTVDLSVVVGLTGLAAAVRYPYLWAVPRFRDETFNALRALAIYRGELAPLTDVELYMGSFFNYVVAAAFVVLGPTIYVARLVVTAFGVATVAAAYFLGRDVGGRAVGLITAAFMLTNGVHIAAMGHVGFSANITPFFTTLGFWLLHRAITRQRGWTLALSGLFFGMALHTHPITVGFLPGAVGWFLRHGWRWLRTPWPYAAALLFLVAYTPMLVYNVQTGGESLRHATYTAASRPDYARSRPTSLTPEVYLDRQTDYWAMFFGTLTGVLEPRSVPDGYPWDAAPAATAGLGVLGVAWAARRGYSLPCWTIAGFSLILPLFNAAHYDVIGDGRYIAPALPLVYASIGLLIVDLAASLRTRLPAAWAAPAIAGLGVVTVLLVLAPLVFLGRFYARTARAEPTNASLIAAMADLKSHHPTAEPVLLDAKLNDRLVEYASPWDEASVFRVFRFILEFDAIPYEVSRVDETELAERAAQGQPMIVVLSAGRDSRDTAALGRLIERFDLRALDGRSGRPPRPGDRYGIYRLDPSALAGRS